MKNKTFSFNLKNVLFFCLSCAVLILGNVVKSMNTLKRELCPYQSLILGNVVTEKNAFWGM